VPKEIIMPALGMAQDTGKLIAWLKHEGDSVKKGDPIFEVETDKVTVEIEADASGTLANVSASEGEDVPVGQVIALILAEGESAPAKAATAAPASAAAAPVSEGSSTPTGGNGSSSAARSKNTSAPAAANGGTPAGVVLASPKARRIAKEQGIDIADVEGSGPEGAVLTADVLNYTPPTQPAVTTPRRSASPQPTTTPTAPSTAGEAAPMSTGWRTMAQRLTEAWTTIPHFYLKKDVDATTFIDWRERVKNRYEVKVTYTDLLVKIVSLALKRHSQVNASWYDGNIYLNDNINVGLAVAVEDGLIVPVIHDADQLGISAIASRRKEIVEGAQAGKLKLEDMQGGTFTISNLGMYGIDNFNAIVNPPQAAILAVGNIVEKIVPVNGEPVVRPILTLSLSCDHRVVDGARGAEFLRDLAGMIEDPMTIFD